MTARHGVALSTADSLGNGCADVVVVMSRMFADEITQDIKRRAPRAQPRRA
jgi:hypothetical protein